MWIVGAGVLLLTAYVIYRRRSSSSPSSLNTSGTPGPDLTGSSAQEPSGGASNVPGNIPVGLVSQPDVLQQQVQQNDTTSATSPQMIAPPSYNVTGQQAPTYTPPPTYQPFNQPAPAFTSPPSLVWSGSGTADPGRLTGRGFV